MRDRKPSLKCLKEGEVGILHSSFTTSPVSLLFPSLLLFPPCFPPVSPLFPSLLLPQLSPGHSAVYAEVDGVGEEDAGVDQHGHGVGQGVVDEVQVHAVGGGDGGWSR